VTGHDVRSGVLWGQQCLDQAIPAQAVILASGHSAVEILIFWSEASSLTPKTLISVGEDEHFKGLSTRHFMANTQGIQSAAGGNQLSTGRLKGRHIPFCMCPERMVTASRPNYGQVVYQRVMS
jgi:uncharacterized FAD-dependent dehydrogenase